MLALAGTGLLATRKRKQ
ncbi:hypothetical protein [Roseofilum casamattae]